MHVLAKAKRLVVKVGSSLVTNQGDGLDHERHRQLGAADCRPASQSGAKWCWSPPARSPKACNAWAGRSAPAPCMNCRPPPQWARWAWCRSMKAASRKHGLHTAQVLLTHADLADRKRYLNARSTLRTLLDTGRHPHHQRERHRRHRRNQIRRQRHAGRAGRQPDRSRCAGHPHRPDRPVYRRSAQRSQRHAGQPRRRPATPELEAMAGGAGSAYRPRRHAHQDTRRQACGAQRRTYRHRLRPRAGRAAAPAARRSHRHPARSPSKWRWPRASNGWPITCKSAANSCWMRARCSALRKEGKSLLPIGVSAVGGEFERGAVVAILTKNGHDIARGLINYSATEARRIARHPSNEIETILGYVDEPELIHRDNLVLLLATRGCGEG